MTLAPREARPERTGWRDEKMSLRHRVWGFDCPGLNLDCLLMEEYDRTRAVALIEYKQEFAQRPEYGSANYRALCDLADRGSRGVLPVLDVRYGRDLDWWRPVALNVSARDYLPDANWWRPGMPSELPAPTILSERQFVEFLYRLRGRAMPERIAVTLSDAVGIPPAADPLAELLIELDDRRVRLALNRDGEPAYFLDRATLARLAALRGQIIEHLAHRR